MMRLATIVAVVVSLGVGAEARTVRGVAGPKRAAHALRATGGQHQPKALRVPKMPKGAKPYHGGGRRTVRGRA